MSSKLPLKHGPLFGKKLQMDEDKPTERLTKSWVFSKREMQTWSNSDWSWQRGFHHPRELVFPLGSTVPMGVSVSCTTVPFRCFPCVQNRTEQNRAEQKGFCACPRSLGSLGSCCFAVTSAPPRRGLLDPRPVGDRAKPPWWAGLRRGSGASPSSSPAAPVVSSVFLPAHGGVFGHIRHLVLPDPQGFLFPEASFVPGGEGQGIAGFITEINELFPNIP